MNKYFVIHYNSRNNADDCYIEYINKSNDTVHKHMYQPNIMNKKKYRP